MVFGYKLHLTSTTIGDIVVPLTADVTTANVPDNKMYVLLTSSSSSFSVFSLQSLRYIVATLDMMLRNCINIAKVLGIDLVYPVEQYESTPKKRLELVCFYQSALGQYIYSQRRISVEPSLIEHIKSVFRIDPSPAHGFQAISAIVLLSVLLYLLMIYYNCKKNTSNPKSIKYMLGTLVTG